MNICFTHLSATNCVLTLALSTICELVNSPEIFLCPQIRGTGPTRVVLLKKRGRGTGINDLFMYNVL